MPFSNEVIGGNGVLIRNTLQSQNFVTGVSGWQITKSGNAEFNNGTFRGTLTSGTNPGAHVIINDTDGTPLKIYDSSNFLIGYIDKFGVFASRQDIGGGVIDQAFIQGGTLIAQQGGDQGLFNCQQHTGTQGAAISIFSDTAGAASSSGQLTVWSQGVGVGAQPNTVTATERNNGGSIVVSDQLSTNNLVHLEIYSFTTDGSGNCNFPHHCTFTPKMGFLSCEFLAGNAGFYQYAWFTNPFTSTNANAHFNDNLGAAVANKTLRVYGIFLG